MGLFSTYGWVKPYLYRYPKEDCSKVGVNQFSQGTTDKTRGNSLKLCQQRFGLVIRENFFTGKVVKH